MPSIRRNIALTALAAIVSIGGPCAAAADFSGEWRSRTTVRTGDDLDGTTTLRMRQYGRVVCGEWAESVGAGKLLGGNLTGRVEGRRMTANIGEDIYWAKSGRFPNQHHDRALFALQGRELAWYVRDERGRLQKQQVFERVDDRASTAVDKPFADPNFDRLCPRGTDFTAGN